MIFHPKFSLIHIEWFTFSLFFKETIKRFIMYSVFVWRMKSMNHVSCNWVMIDIRIIRSHMLKHEISPPFYFSLWFSIKIMNFWPIFFFFDNKTIVLALSRCNHFFFLSKNIQFHTMIFNFVLFLASTHQPCDMMALCARELNVKMRKYMCVQFEIIFFSLFVLQSNIYMQTINWQHLYSCEWHRQKYNSFRIIYEE